MFPDSFWFQFVVFLLAQGLAYGFLRTGLLLRGWGLLVSSWIAADVALVCRFVFDQSDGLYLWALVVLQVHTMIEAVLMLVGRLRHHSPQLQQDREERYRAAFRAYLRNRLDPAADTFRRLARRDPWDLESLLAWATVLNRQGEGRKARWLLMRVGWLDRSDRYRDVIEVEVERSRA